jgi:hypothetical protein
MNRTTKAVATIATGAVLALVGCGDDALDSTVIFEHEPIMAQPWIASGELVDAGLLCPAGDRQNTGMMHPDGTPWPLEEHFAAVEAAYDNGGSHWDVPRKGWEEYVCDDGSGTFTLLEEATEGSPGQFTAEITSGTGAYVDMTGSCVIDLTENEDYTEILEMVGTCDFDMGTVE